MATAGAVRTGVNKAHHRRLVHARQAAQHTRSDFGGWATKSVRQAVALPLRLDPTSGGLRRRHGFGHPVSDRTVLK